MLSFRHRRLIVKARKNNWDFSGMMFKNADFSNIDFTQFGTKREVDILLKNWNLSDTSFDGSTFEGSNFAFLHIYGMRLRNAYFTNCNFKNCNFKKTLIDRSDLSYLRLTGSDFTGSDFTQLEFMSSFMDNMNLSECSFIRCNFNYLSIDRSDYGLHYLKLRKTKFNESTFIAASITKSDISGSSFNHADFSDCDFTALELKFCDFYGSDFSYIKLDNLKFNSPIPEKEHEYYNETLTNVLDEDDGFVRAINFESTHNYVNLRGSKFENCCAVKYHVFKMNHTDPVTMIKFSNLDNILYTAVSTNTEFEKTRAELIEYYDEKIQIYEHNIGSCPEELISIKERMLKSVEILATMARDL